MIKRLGARTWRRLHRLVYVAAVLGVLHYLWLAKVGVHTPWIYAAVLALLLGIRVVDGRPPAFEARGVSGPRGGAVLGSGPHALARLATIHRRRLLLAGCATTALSVVADGGGDSATREVLPNGLVLITQEHRAADVVALQLWVRVGGRDESASELGLSHYLEHMLFKGTPTRPPGSIDTLIEGARRHQQRVHLVRLHALRRRGARRARCARPSSSSPTSA